MKKSFHPGLRSKILIPILGITSLSLIIAIYSSYSRSKEALEETITNQIVQVGKSTANHLDSLILRTQKDIKSLSYQKLLSSFLLETEKKGTVRDEINELLENTSKEFGFYEMLIMADAEGRVVAAAQPSVIGEINVKDRESFKQSIMGKPFVSDTLKSKSSGNPVFVISTPISVEGKVGGILMGVVDLSHFSNKYLSQINVAGGYAYIYNKEGIIVSHPDEKQVLELDLNTLDFGREMIRMKEGTISYTWRGVDKIVSFYPLKATSLTLGITANEAVAFAAVAGILWRSIAILIVSILLISVIIITIVNRLLKPVSVIEKGVRGVVKGDLSHRITVNGQDEMGRIADVINHLLESFQTAIGNVVSVMNNVAHGDLSQKVEGEYEGEIKNLQDGIDRSLSLLSKTITQVASVTDQVSTGAHQLSLSAQSLASGTSNQAANLEEIASSMNEISSRSANNSENASSAHKIAVSSLEAVQNGSLQMKDMNRSMLEIRDTSNEVSKVIKVIEEIAFQTNLLALNAAVEAARAGKYGKGFAVVAEEVRSLASRSAEAARTTTELIENSTREVEKGVLNAEHTSQALEQIVEQVEKMNDIIGEITAASNEQTQMTDQIDKGIADVNEVVQENSAISEETSSAVNVLSGQALELNKLIKNFTVRDDSEELDTVAPEYSELSNPEIKPARPKSGQPVIAAPQIGFQKS